MSDRIIPPTSLGKPDWERLVAQVVNSHSKALSGGLVVTGGSFTLDDGTASASGAFLMDDGGA